VFGFLSDQGKEKRDSSLQATPTRSQEANAEEKVGLPPFGMTWVASAEWG